MTDISTLISYSDDIETAIDQAERALDNVRDEQRSLHSEIEDFGDDLDELEEWRALGDLDAVRDIVEDGVDTVEFKQLQEDHAKLKQLYVDQTDLIGNVIRALGGVDSGEYNRVSEQLAERCDHVQALEMHAKSLAQSQAELQRDYGIACDERRTLESQVRTLLANEKDSYDRGLGEQGIVDTGAQGIVNDERLPTLGACRDEAKSREVDINLDGYES